MNGLEIANRRIKEKEKLTEMIYNLLLIEIAEFIAIAKQEGCEPNIYEKQRLLIKTHILAEETAEKVLYKQRIGLI